jgi:hypothetical protein
MHTAAINELSEHGTIVQERKEWIGEFLWKISPTYLLLVRVMKAMFSDGADSISYLPTFASCLAFFALFFFSRDGMLIHQGYGGHMKLKRLFTEN